MCQCTRARVCVCVLTSDWGYTIGKVTGNCVHDNDLWTSFLFLLWFTHTLSPTPLTPLFHDFFRFWEHHPAKPILSTEKQMTSKVFKLMYKFVCIPIQHCWIMQKTPIREDGRSGGNGENVSILFYPPPPPPPKKKKNIYIYIYVCVCVCVCVCARARVCKITIRLQIANLESASRTPPHTYTRIAKSRFLFTKGRTDTFSTKSRFNDNELVFFCSTKWLDDLPR